MPLFHTVIRVYARGGDLLCGVGGHVIPYGHPRIRTRKDPRLSLSPDSSAELKAAMPRPSEGAAAPSEQSGTGSPFFSSAPSQSPDGGGAIGGRHLMKKVPTVTGCGVSREIVLSVGSGSPLHLVTCSAKQKQKGNGKSITHGSRSARKTRKRCRRVQRRNRCVIGMPFPTRF